MHAIVSIHDVMPETIGNVANILERLPFIPPAKIALLVVPGLVWTAPQLTQLRQWQADGYELAGHGWLHLTSNITTPYHKLHSRLISRNVAEHLSLSESAVAALVDRNFEWWMAQRFALPTLYVPPAWALGNLSRATMNELPFRFFETNVGLYDSEAYKLTRLPLVGYEADTLVRTAFLRGWNWLNVQISSAERPVRISIHPYDFEYRLSHTILPTLRAVDRFYAPSELA